MLSSLKRKLLGSPSGPVGGKPISEKRDDSFWARPLWQQLNLAALLSLMVHGVIVAIQGYVVSPLGLGGELLLFMAYFLALPLLLLALLGVPLSLLALPFQHIRRHAMTLLLCGSVYLLVGLPSMGLGRAVRMAGFHLLAKKSSPVVAAIHQFTHDQGHPPAALRELVPLYLPSIPSTGIPAYPEYLYDTAEDPDECDGNPWILFVSTPSGIINFDLFLYYPKQNYPDRGYGGYLERVGDWAYVHE